MSAESKILIVGVGSMFGDDQAGWLVAGQLTDTKPARRNHSSVANRSGNSPCGGRAEDPAVSDRRLRSQPCRPLPGSDESDAVDLCGAGCVRLATVPLDILDWMDDIHDLHLIDACRSEQPAGTVRRLVWAEQRQQLVGGPDNDVLQLGGQSTHDFGLTQVLQLAEATDRLPPRVIIWAIDGKNFKLEHIISPAVARVIETLAVTIRQEISLNRTSINL